jgi:Putative peptidoglycan binding domain
MVARDDSTGTKIDPDDWFSDADRPNVEEQRRLAGGDGAAAREPTWLEDVAEPEQAPKADSPFARRRLVALAVAVLLLIVAIVVAVVAFGSGGASTPTVAATTTPATPTTTTPAATVPATTVPATTPPPTPAVNLPTGVLRPGATGAEVKTLQRALAQAGHSPGPIDGDYGPKTEQAVSDLQLAAGITVDGHYGPETKKALQQALNSG